jgi:hypothetical protein
VTLDRFNGKDFRFVALRLKEEETLSLVDLFTHQVLIVVHLA